MDVLPCISVAGSVLLTLTCCVASSELATTFVPSNQPSDHHYHGVTQTLIGNSDATNFDDVTNMSPTDLSPVEDIATTQLSVTHEDALSDHEIEGNSGVVDDNVSLTTESVRSRTSYLGEGTKESLKTATFLPDSSTSSYLPPHSLLKFGVEGGGKERTPWPEGVEQTSLPSDVDTAQTLPPTTAKIDDLNIKLSQTTATTASASEATVKRRTVRRTTAPATPTTATRVHEVGRSRLHGKIRSL
ncbi:uncharacterized protein [Diadema antillarum]|uniref:uncharacterized protein n=1 Tax=Diadema antillarum TaxID=105358 RepID=UPI003A87CDDF